VARPGYQPHFSAIPPPKNLGYEVAVFRGKSSGALNMVVKKRQPHGIQEVIEGRTGRDQPCT
jgi:hypothetical protein